MKAKINTPWLQVIFLALLTTTALLIVYGPESPSADDRKIVIDDADLAQLIAQWQRTWNRMPTREEVKSALEHHTREEVLYQEALKQGLDRTNAAVRRALINQMDVLAEVQGEQTEITEQDINAYYNLRKDQFISPSIFSFKQVYFGQDAIQSELDKLRDNWNDNQTDLQTASLEGTTTMLPGMMENRSSIQVDREFGEGFAESLLTLQPGKWNGPVESSFGWHLIYMDSIIAPATLPLSEVRQEIFNQLQYEEKNAAKEQFYTELMQQYDITYTGLAKEVVND